MPVFRIHLTNSEFESFDESEYPSLDAARKMAIATATKIASESVLDVETSIAIQVEIHEQSALVARHVVTLSVADLSGAEASIN
jgi:hypothetical protein